MDPEKENKENKYDMKTTVNALHDSGIDIVEGSLVSEGNEFTPGEAPKLDHTQSVPKVSPIPQVLPTTPPRVPEPSQPGMNRPSAQNIIDGVLGIGSVKTVDNSKNDPSIKPLRTFKTDAEEAVKYNNVSKINMVVAEQKRREEAPMAKNTPIEYEDTGKSSRIFVVILILGLMLAIGAGAYYWFFVRVVPTAPQIKVPKGLVVKTPISYDKVDTAVMTAGQDPLFLISEKILATDVPISQVFALLPLPPGTTTIMATPASLFSQTKIPDRLKRSISGDYMIGSYFSNANNPFIILKNTFFQNAFAGMLDWEKNMRNDLISIIKISYPEQITLDTSNDIFSDLVVSNVNARVLKDDKGRIILGYAFADTNTIVIATNVETLKFTIDKLLAVRVVQ